MRKLLLLTFAFLLLGTFASAQIPTSGTVFLGYSYARANVVNGDNSNFNGWNGSLEGKFLPWVGLVADFAGHYGTNHFPAGGGTTIPVDAKIHTFLFGPQVSVSVGRITPFAHALFGAGHVSTNASGFSDSDTSFATALGGGVDYKLIPAVGWRTQIDFLQTRFFSDTQNDFRLSTGIALHF